MFEKILLAVDGSRQSSKAVSVASKIAQSYAVGGQASVEVCHVREFEFARPGGEVPREESSEAHAIVAAAVERLLAEGVSAKGTIVPAEGTAAQALLQEARSSGADLIVMGSRGRSDLAALLHGSVSHKIVQHTDCPALIVR